MALLVDPTANCYAAGMILDGDAIKGKGTSSRGAGEKGRLGPTSRHSCATRLSDREELVTVAEILGHTDIRMTKRYSHGMQERKREALEKLVSFSPRQPHAKNVRQEKRQGPHPALSR